MLNFLKSIPQIFYSRAFYADLLRRDHGIGIRFMLLSLILSLLVPAVGLFTLPDGVGLKVEHIFTQLPQMTFKESKLSIDQTSPYTVQILKETEAPNAVLFDTSPRAEDVGQIEDTIAKQKLFALVTSDFIATRKNSGTIEIQNFRNFGDKTKNYQVTHEDWAAIGGKIVKWALPLSVAFLLFFSAIGVLILTFFQALIAKLIALFFTYRPDLSGAMRLAAVAGIPAGLLHCVVAAINMGAHATPAYKVPFYIGILLWSIIVVYGLFVADRDAKTAPAHTDTTL